MKANSLLCMVYLEIVETLGSVSWNVNQMRIGLLDQGQQYRHLLARIYLVYQYQHQHQLTNLHHYTTEVSKMAEWNKTYSIVTFGADSIQQRPCRPYYHDWDNHRRSVTLTSRNLSKDGTKHQTAIRYNNTINHDRENNEQGGVKPRAQHLWQRLRGYVRNPQLRDRKRPVLESRSSTVGTQESSANCSAQSSPVTMIYQLDADTNFTSPSGLISSSYASTFDSPYTRKALAKSKSMASPNAAKSIIDSSYVSKFHSPSTRAALARYETP